MGRLKPFWPLLALLALWIGLSLGAERLDLDQTIIRTYFYQPDRGFFLEDWPPFAWAFEYGTLPGLLLTLVALGAWGLSLISPAWSRFRRQWAVVALTAIVGGGILVNGLLKDYWGRPRPREVTQFGGRWEYRPALSPGLAGRGHSFPCGHCTSGFLVVSLGVFIPTAPVLGSLAAGAGLGYGIFVSLARMAQGGHFPVDAFWALGVVLFTCLFLYRISASWGASNRPSQLSGRQKAGLALGIVVFSLLVVLAFMTRRPYFKTYFEEFALAPETQELLLEISEEPQSLNILYGPVEKAQLEVNVQGFGWTQATHRTHYWGGQEGVKSILKIRLEPIGDFSELNHQLTLTLPLAYQTQVSIQTRFQLDPPFN